jgi:hypothetical protein
MHFVKPFLVTLIANKLEGKSPIFAISIDSLNWFNGSWLRRSKTQFTTH